MNGEAALPRSLVARVVVASLLAKLGVARPGGEARLLAEESAQ